MARDSIAENNLAYYYLYVDEFHNVVTETFENLLSEARKYGICLNMAHQFTGQVSPKVLAAVLGNVGSIIIFRVGGEDAMQLKPELVPVFGEKDMINLGMREFYIKMTIDGDTHDPFSAETLKITPPPYQSLKREIIEASRGKYATRIEEAKRLMEEEEKGILHEEPLI